MVLKRPGLNRSYSGSEYDDDDVDSGELTSESSCDIFQGRNRTIDQLSYDAIRELLLDIGAKRILKIEQLHTKSLGQDYSVSFYVTKHKPGSNAAYHVRNGPDDDPDAFYSDERKGILCFPGFSWGSNRFEFDVRDQVAILSQLSRTFLHVPEPLAFDVTNNNPAKWPYLYTRSIERSHRLDVLYRKMTIQERFTVASGLITEMAQVERFRFHQAGKLRYAKGTLPDKDPESSKYSFFADKKKYGAKKFITHTNIEVMPLGSPRTERPTSLWDLMQSAFDSHYSRRTLLPILDHMKDLGFFSDKYSGDETLPLNVLCLPGLSSSDIVVQPVHEWGTSDKVEHGEDQRWKIRGIVNWDNAISAPVFVARKPPAWLWQVPSAPEESMPWHEEPYPKTTDDRSGMKHYETMNKHLSKENLKVKLHYEKRFVKHQQRFRPAYTRDEYIEEAYGTGLWLRHLWEAGMNPNTQAAYLRFMSEWESVWGKVPEKEDDDGISNEDDDKAANEDDED